jgi:hypothetical protein
VVQTGTPAQTVVTPEAAKPAEKPAAQGVERTLVGRIFIIIIAGFIGLLGFTILYLILWAPDKYRINLSRLISESDGTASMSRFQLLVFTFVIASGLFIIIIQTGDFPVVKAGILQLLGISSGSYLGAKVIQSIKDTSMGKTNPTPDSPVTGKPEVKPNAGQEQVP